MPLLDSIGGRSNPIDAKLLVERQWGGIASHQLVEPMDCDEGNREGRFWDLCGDQEGVAWCAKTRHVRF